MTEPRDERYDAIVVGSGLGGVSAAALLAKHGYKVLICEQGEGAGGLAHAFSRGPYTFDSAIRVLAEGEMIENLLRYLGVEDECTLTTIDPLYRVNMPDGFSLVADIGLEPFMESHIREFPHEEAGIRSFFGLRRQMFLEAAQMPMQLDPRQLGDAMEKFPTLFKYRTATLQDVLDDHLHDPKLKAVCCALWPYLAMPPSQLSFFAYSQFIGVLVDGPSYCMGTFQKLVDAFVTAVERGGGELVVHSAVETYKNPVVGLMEVGLVGAVLFHALNGLRIIAVDFWSKGPKYQRLMFWVVVGGFVVLFVPFAIRHLTIVFTH